MAGPEGLWEPGGSPLSDDDGDGGTGGDGGGGSTAGEGPNKRRSRTDCWKQLKLVQFLAQLKAENPNLKVLPGGFSTILQKLAEAVEEHNLELTGGETALSMDGLDVGRLRNKWQQPDFVKTAQALALRRLARAGGVSGGAVRNGGSDDGGGGGSVQQQEEQEEQQQGDKEQEKGGEEQQQQPSRAGRGTKRKRPGARELEATARILAALPPVGAEDDLECDDGVTEVDFGAIQKAASKQLKRCLDVVEEHPSVQFYAFFELPNGRILANARGNVFNHPKVLDRLDHAVLDVKRKAIEDLMSGKLEPYQPPSPRAVRPKTAGGVFPQFVKRHKEEARARGQEVMPGVPANAKVYAKGAAAMWKLVPAEEKQRMQAEWKQNAAAGSVACSGAPDSTASEQHTQAGLRQPRQGASSVTSPLRAGREGAPGGTSERAPPRAAPAQSAAAQPSLAATAAQGPKTVASAQLASALSMLGLQLPIRSGQQQPPPQREQQRQQQPQQQQQQGQPDATACGVAAAAGGAALLARRYAELACYVPQDVGFSAYEASKAWAPAAAARFRDDNEGQHALAFLCQTGSYTDGTADAAGATGLGRLFFSSGGTGSLQPWRQATVAQLRAWMAEFGLATYHATAFDTL